MKALAIVSEHQLEIIDKNQPKLKGNQVLVRLKAAALNKRDQFIGEGKYPGIKFGSTLGSDGSGEIVEVGKSIDDKNIGRKVIINPNIEWGSSDEVQSPSYNILGMPSDGTFAEYVAVDFDRIHDLPKNLNYAEAAALPLAGLTAFRACFHHGKIDDKKNVLISGFGGGVAQYAFQFAVASDANVYVTSSSQNKLEAALKMGAKGVFNYRELGWHKEALKNGHQFDVVIDSAGSDQINTFVKLMKPGGRIVFYGATNGLPKSLDLYRMFWNQITLQGSTMGSDKEFDEMLTFVEQKEITPLIESIRPFSQIFTSLEEMSAGHKLGKLVIGF